MNKESIKKFDGFSKSKQKEIIFLQKQREDIKRHMDGYSLDDRNVLLHFKEWKKNEYKLQEAWGFEKNDLWHCCFLLKHCSCSRLDNKDDYGIRKHISSCCILHGESINEREL